jgi:hypothetical protein
LIIVKRIGGGGVPGLLAVALRRLTTCARRSSGSASRWTKKTRRAVFRELTAFLFAQ